MAKKKTTANYRMGDLVVVKSTDWNKNVKYEVGMITNVRYATQLTKKTYDIRTEAGTALIYTSVDEPKSKQTIVSSVTDAWIENGGSNNMWIHKRDGHTRANYSKDIKLRYDGQSQEQEGQLIVGQFEKYNDFVFPTQGPRSF
tara:strand:+ start:250 stop:678 length:429 start_codon:yes stop_codon:yes gene_type:complete